MKKTIIMVFLFSFLFSFGQKTDKKITLTKEQSKRLIGLINSPQKRIETDRKIDSLEKEQEKLIKQRKKKWIY